MQINSKEVLLIYDDHLMRDRKARSLAMSLPRYTCKEWNLRSQQLTERQIAELAQRLNLKVKDLVATNSETFKDNYTESDLDDHDWLTTLKENPDMMRTPIVLFQSMGRVLDSGFDLIKKKMKHESIQNTMAGKQEKQH